VNALRSVGSRLTLFFRPVSPTMRPAQRAQLQIHFCVFLWGFTAILGKLITLAALPLVWWRMLIVVTVLLFVPRVRKGLGEMPRRLALSYALAGLLVALHWFSFYGAIKLADASVAVTCIALAPIFLAFLEPFIARRPFRPLELLLGVAVVPGVALVLGGIPPRMHVGVLVGALSAMLVALFGALNKRLVGRADALTVTCLELGVGTLLLTALALVLPHSGSSFPIPTAHDAVLLLVLSTACTLLPFALSLVALRHLTAYEVQLATNLEPVYAITLATLLLGERRELGVTFYAGVVIILGVVFAYPALVRPPRPVGT
jgi:drug/metabolite transporter (DMT)-like permease